MKISKYLGSLHFHTHWTKIKELILLNKYSREHPTEGES